MTGVRTEIPRATHSLTGLVFRRAALALLGVVVATIAAAATAADDFPARTVRIVVAQAAGGTPDMIGRFVAEPLARALGVPVVVENRPGANGVVGANFVRQSPADGYTLLIGTVSTLVLAPLVSANVPFDARRDFATVVNLFRSIKVLWINAALPIADVHEWIAYVRARPGKLNYASGGVGGTNHVDMEIFNAESGLDMVHVPYNGPAAAIAAVASGEAQAMIVSIGGGQGLAQAGKVRGMTIFADQRSSLLPNVPTANELGLKHRDLSAWIGLMAPAGTPPQVIARINTDVATLLRSPEAIAWAGKQGLEIIGGTPADFAKDLGDDIGEWTAATAKMHLKRE
jgi:tripartite-type tricarboxylate transporter receptor subunit TctC